MAEYGQNISLYGAGRSHFMQQSGPTEIAVSRLKGGASVTQLLHEANGPALGDYLFQFLCKTPRSVETIAGLAD